MARDINAYMRDYRARHYAERVALGIARLGGKCAKCGAQTELEFDHKDPNTKTFELTEKTWMKLCRWLVELDKCQLLCRSCHIEKTTFDRGQCAARGTHGTLAAYRYCKCDRCRAAKAAWQKSYMHARKEQVAGSIPARGSITPIR